MEPVVFRMKNPPDERWVEAINKISIDTSIPYALVDKGWTAVHQLFLKNEAGQYIPPEYAVKPDGMSWEEHRKTLSHQEKSTWELWQGKPNDVWQRILAFNVIDPRSKRFLTIMVGKSGHRSVMNAITLANTYRQYRPEDQLPMIMLGSQPRQLPSGAMIAVPQITVDIDRWIRNPLLPPEGMRHIEGPKAGVRTLPPKGAVADDDLDDALPDEAA
jgi:hypothetical protein